MSKQLTADKKVAKMFREILADHFALMSSRTTSGDAQQFKKLLEGFSNAYAVATTVEADEAKRDREVFVELFPGYGKALERWREGQEENADAFNLLEVMQLTWKETRHSRILAWLLDWDMTRLGTHAQGNRGFQLFLEEVGLPGEYASGEYDVRMEFCSEESRIDIEVAEQGCFVIHIENKIRSGEGYDQTKREWRDLQKRAATLGCAKEYAFYLTPGGADPGSQEFQAISWRKIATVFEKFADAAKPEDVRLFARHYAKVLKTNIIPPELDDKESDYGCGQVQ